MNAQDDELVKRYREASLQDDARPGLHVRGAVRAHAQMMAAATLSAASSAAEAVPVAGRVAANASRWKISALASVALLGLTGLLMLQFERGTSDEKELAYGNPRNEAVADAVAANTQLDAVAAAPTPASAPISASPSTSKPTSASPDVGTHAAREAAKVGTSDPERRAANPEPPAAKPLSKAAPSAQHAEKAAPFHRDDAPSSFPGSLPNSAGPSSSPRLESPDAPLAQMRERRAVLSEPAEGVVAPAPASSLTQPSAAAARSMAPMQAAPATGSLQSKSTANDSQSEPSAVNRDRKAFLENSLREAASAGRTLEVENLVKQGVSVNASSSAGSTALMLAARNGQSRTVQKLLAMGANPALVDREGLTAAQQARLWGYSSIGDLIDAGS